MKIAIGMPFKNDEDILPYTLPKIPQNFFKEAIFVDTGSSDKSKDIILYFFPKAIIIPELSDAINFALWRNIIIGEATTKDVEWMFMLDSDETLFPKAYEVISSHIENDTDTSFELPRIDFIGDKYHYREDVFPDWQRRLFKLHQSYYYDLKIHATLFQNGVQVDGTKLFNALLYHWGWTRNFEMKLLQYYNSMRSEEGLPLTDVLPNDAILRQKIVDTSGWKIRSYYGDLP